MKLTRERIVYVLYTLLIVAVGVYSYSQVDPNITFIQHPVWVNFRDVMVYLGYYMRDVSWYIYLGLVTLLFVFHYLLLKLKHQYPAKLSIIIGTILILSYPFLSHDFLKYMFDARILTFYHENPYLHPPLDFPDDNWLRFLHWIHQPFRYGPVFLFAAIVSSFLSFGKFSISFVLLKTIFSGFYVAGVYFLNKINKRQAMILATHPLVIIEGLVVSHNDLIAVSLGIIGIYLLFQKKTILSRVLLILSAGIKYLTLPIVFLSRKQDSLINILVFLTILFLPFIAFIPFFSSLLQIEIHSWYFLALFIFLPYFPRVIENCTILFAGLLLSYYPYIRFGGWDKPEKVHLKQQIIVTAFIVNLIYLLFIFRKEIKSRILQQMKLRPKWRIF